MLFLDQRELLLDFGRLDQPRAGAERLGRGELALDLLHAVVVADARDFEAADAGVVAHLFVEIDGVERRPARQEIVAGRVAEVGGMRCRADVGRHAGLVDADDVVPAALDQVMGDRGADDAAQPDDDDLRLCRKLCHCPLTPNRIAAQTIKRLRRDCSLFATLPKSRATRKPKSQPVPVA